MGMFISGDEPVEVEEEDVKPKARACRSDNPRRGDNIRGRRNMTGAV